MCPDGSVLESLGGLGVQVAKGAVQEAQRNRTETCAKRYAQCGLGDTCLPKHKNYCIFLTCNKNAKMEGENDAKSKAVRIKITANNKNA